MSRLSLLFWIVMSCLFVGTSDSEIYGQKNDTQGVMKSEQIQKVVELKVRIKSEEEKDVIGRIGLECIWGNEVVCRANETQLNELKKTGIEFDVLKEGINFHPKGGTKGSVYGSNEAV